MGHESPDGPAEAPEGHLKAEDIAKAAAASVHRYKPEALFSKTGAGSLSPASTRQRASEEAHSTTLIRKLKQRAQRSGKTSDGSHAELIALPESLVRATPP